MRKKKTNCISRYVHTPVVGNLFAHFSGKGNYDPTHCFSPAGLCSSTLNQYHLTSRIFQSKLVEAHRERSNLKVVHCMKNLKKQKFCFSMSFQNIILEFFVLKTNFIVEQKRFQQLLHQTSKKVLLIFTIRRLLQTF